MSPAARLGLFYGLIFAMTGISLPFWPVFLAGRGLDPDQIGLVLGAGYAVKVVSVPFWTSLADRRGERKRLIVGLALAAFLLYLGYLGVSGFLGLLLLSIAATGAFSAVVPLTDTTALAHARSGAVDYGRVRLWGSITFILSTFSTGLLLAGRSSEIVLGLMLAACLSLVLGSLLLPEVREPPGPARGLLAGARPVLGNRGLLRLFLAAGLIQCSHAVYYGFSALDWRAGGHSEVVVSALWVLGVLCEIVLFVWGKGLTGRLGPRGLLLLAGALGAVRWIATALSNDLVVLVPAQALHAFSFAAAHLGAMAYLQQRAPAGLSATAQGLYAALPQGIGSALAAALAGQLYAAYGATAYLGMAAMAVAGTALTLRLR